MQVLLRRYTQLPPSRLLYSLNLLPDNSIIGLFLGSHNDDFVFNSIMPLIEVEIGGEETSDDGDSGKDEGGEEDIVTCLLVRWTHQYHVHQSTWSGMGLTSNDLFPWLGKTGDDDATVDIGDLS